MDCHSNLLAAPKRGRKRHLAAGNPVALYDREKYNIYRAADAATQPQNIEIVDSGRHGLASQRKVPVFQLRISEGLWLMNKAALLQLEHFNKSNALAWALTMGLFAMPVVYSEREWSQMVGESYYIQLGPDDRFGWTEPEGKVYQIAADNLTRLQEEILRFWPIDPVKYFRMAIS